MPALPACCLPTADASPAERAYCAYNAAGDPEMAGLNFRREPCPVWADLPQNVRVKWEAVARILSDRVDNTIASAPDRVRHTIPALEEDR